MTTIDLIRLVFGCFFLISGIIIFLVEMFGIFHLKFVLNRMHAAALGDTLGITLCMIGLMIFSGLNANTVKMALIIVFLWFSSPVASHLIAKMEIEANPEKENIEYETYDLKELESLSEAEKEEE